MLLIEHIVYKYSLALKFLLDNKTKKIKTLTIMLLIKYLYFVIM